MGHGVNYTQITSLQFQIYLTMRKTVGIPRAIQNFGDIIIIIMQIFWNSARAALRRNGTKENYTHESK
jgi:hypothetical protein